MNSKNHTFISILAAFIAAGIPVSTATASELDFTDPLFLLSWSVLGIIASFGTFLYFNLKRSDIIGTFIIGYMLAVILRFVIDVIVNSMTHSNLGLSLLLAMAVGAFNGWAGSGLWLLMKRNRVKKK